MLNNAPGIPGISSLVTAGSREVWAGDDRQYKPGVHTIDGALSRDTGNTGNLDFLRAGLLMGKVTSGGKYAPSILGLTGTAYASGTTLNVAAATAVEIARRIGTSGTFKVTGPPSAAGTVRTATVTFSAVNTSTGDVTITALGADQVERIRFNIASTGGNLQLNVAKPDGTFVTTANAAWSATDATYLAAINSALDTATGVVGGIVATAISATDTDLGITLTYSGTGYAGLAWRAAQVVVIPTSSTEALYEPVTTAVPRALVAGSLVRPTDGSETALTFIDNGDYPLKVTDVYNASIDVDFGPFPVGGLVTCSNFIHWPADTSTRAALQAELNAVTGGRFLFTDRYDA